MAYTVEVIIDTAVKCYHFEYETEKEAKAIIIALQGSIGKDDVANVRIQNTVIRTDVIQSAHLLTHNTQSESKNKWLKCLKQSTDSKS